MGLWDGIEDAEVFDQGNYFPPGKFVVEVDRVLTKRSRKSGQDLFLVECNVISAITDANGWVRGSRGTWCQSMKNRKVALNAIFEFMLAAFQIDHNDKQYLDREVKPYISGTLDARVTSAENALQGRIFDLNTWNKRNQDNTGDYTVHDWTLIDYKAMGLPVPMPWQDFRVMSQQPQYGRPQNYHGYQGGQPWGTPAPQYGAFPAPPPAPPGPQVSADGLWYLPPGGREWLPMPRR